MGARPILAIDTTGPWCAAALRRADGEVFTRAEEIGRGHAEHLAPMVADLLDAAGVAPNALQRIAVAAGPGSFAGTRVGVAFARGLALASGARAVGVSSLAAIARRADPDGDHTVLAVHDAKRGELVWTVFANGAPVTGLERGDVDAATAVLAEFGEIRLAGSGAAALGADPAHFDPAPPLDALLDLGEAAPADAPPPAPVYVRPPDARLPGGVAP
ncbi:tRNA (adenosine(37)-N6)-threonylcarbamoyltransferase complex dimerization subunit type 1 TsaB [Marinicauda salina]|uniref:tRNA (Adenosine(37)-N6)-threonylcarbamoyltransferase complex dimerization subunit type 1 TsaB n=1 Tax=Marinicauda salina TaxID=2135793 RepID=A0A2U2BWD6_9PROT|nr:tRNA (adenosine(37)-N6)-threonylcarbamoyltransferase complex dimerization subunit type 1 TsaB [Marinicauda salina]PWE18331.1 tRNA (adenosine(37)-N6)-threonylcarbamoyltransferase complex dimerization subunit type 1 TsaB [Marinicauda salina]